MARQRTRPAIGSVIYLAVAFTLASYFAIAGVQGEYGLFRQIEIDAEAELLRVEKAQMTAEVDVLRNRTRRLSDDFLDLDLLDEQARDVLGYARPDEVVIR